MATTYLSPGVYVEEVEAGSRPIEGVGTSVAAFVGLTSKGEPNKPTLITNWSQFVKEFGDFMDGSYLAHAVYGYFLNGGGASYVVKIGANGAGPAAHADLQLGRDRTPYRITAREPGQAGNEITVDLADASEPGEDLFRLIVKRGAEEEVYDNVTTRRGRRNVVTATRTSRLIKLEELTGATTMDSAAQTSLALTGGGVTAPVRVTPDAYIGNSADRTGFGGLEAVEDVTMLAVPDLMVAYQAQAIDLDQVQAIQGAMIAHCELMGDRVAILDPPPGMNAQQIREWRVDKARYDSKYASLYWPWIEVFDPLSGDMKLVPPSGHMAGIWARSDDTRGVHKAPANEVVRGAVNLERLITKGEHDQLNPQGINCIRAFPGRGIRVWGARTLSSDSAWKYINVRRLFNFIEESILQGTQWVVFEPNDIALWERVKRTINAFLVRLWRDGALFGATPQEAFYVKCDSETNPTEVIDAGQLVVEIGIAPVKPAEFVVFRIAQFSGGASLTE